jgi:hypothetical protein
MGRRNNILSHLIKNENDTTKLLYALLTYKPFSNALLRLFTNGKVGTADLSWDDMSIQTTIGGSIPDLSILGEGVNIVVEVKTTPWRGLTDNQPQSYLQWLAAQDASKAGYFVAIVPPGYDHLLELKRRITSFHDSNTLNPVTSSIVTWDDVLETLCESDLDQMNPYIRDFCDLLNSWYEIPVTKFTFEEVCTMYDANTAKAIRKLLRVVEDVISGIEQKGYKVEHGFQKKWWEREGEYGGYVKCDDQNVLWFGLWQDYWEKSGVPLCFGVQDRQWDARICKEFIRMHPNYTRFPSNDPRPFVLENIQKDIILSEDPVARILSMLEKDLQLLCEQIKDSKKA